MIAPLTGFDAQLLRKMQEVIEARILEKSAEVAAGLAPDMFDYGKRCGYINGLRDSLKLLDETAKKLMGDDRPNEQR